jgi:hypothetical protein
MSAVDQISRRMALLPPVQQVQPHLGAEHCGLLPPYCLLGRVQPSVGQNQMQPMPLGSRGTAQRVRHRERTCFPVPTESADIERCHLLAWIPSRPPIFPCREAGRIG